MANPAAVQIHRRPETVGDFFLLLEVVLACIEKFGLIPGQSRDSTAGVGSVADSGIRRDKRRCNGGCDPAVEEVETDQSQDGKQDDKQFSLHSFYLANWNYLRQKRSTHCSVYQ